MSSPPLTKTPQLVTTPIESKEKKDHKITPTGFSIPSHFSPKAQEAIRRVAENDPTFMWFHHSNYEIYTENEMECITLYKAFENNHTITMMHLQRKHTSNAEIQALIKMLDINRTINYLSFCTSFISEEASISLVKALGSNRTLTTLDLNIRPHLSWVIALFQALEDNHRLICLRLTGNHIDDKVVEIIPRLLENNDTLSYLHLDYNKIGDLGAQALEKMLETNHTLIGLTLSANSIGAAGATALYKSLKINRTLSYLGGISLGDTGTQQAFSDLLKAGCSLTKLAISSHGIGDVCEQALAFALKTNRTLTHLELVSDIPISEVGVKALIKALEKNYTLTDLTYNNKDKISTELQQTITKYLERNQRLQKDLIAAIEKGDLVTMQSLIGQGVYVGSNIFYYHIGYYTPLMKAVLARNLNAVKILLQYDDYPHIANSANPAFSSFPPKDQGKSALEMAEARGYTIMAALIRAAIADRKQHPKIQDEKLRFKTEDQSSTTSSSSPFLSSSSLTTIPQLVTTSVESKFIEEKILSNPTQITSILVDSASDSFISSHSDSVSSTSLEEKSPQGFSIYQWVQPRKWVSGIASYLFSSPADTPTTEETEEPESSLLSNADTSKKEEDSLLQIKQELAELKQKTVLPGVDPTLVERWRITFPNLEEQLATLQQQTALLPKQVESLLQGLSQITPKVQEMEEHLTALDQELDRDPKSRAEREQIAQDPKLLRYYQTVRKLHYHFLAAQVILSGKVEQADDVTDTMIKGAAALGKQIPGVSLLVSVLELGSLSTKGISKHRAITRLATWVPDTQAGDRLAERFARQLTLAKISDIQHPQTKIDQHPAKTLVEKLCASGKSVYASATHLKDEAKQKYRELKENKSYSPEERLALADTLQVLEAIMGERILPNSTLIDREKIFIDRLQLMYKEVGVTLPPVQSTLPDIQKITSTLLPTTLVISPPMTLLPVVGADTESVKALQDELAQLKAERKKEKDKMAKREIERAKLEEERKQQEMEHKTQMAHLTKELEAQKTEIKSMEEESPF